MSRLYEIINNIKDRVLNNTSQTLSSSNWTASSSSFTSGFYVRYGNVLMIGLTLKVTSAMSAGTEYNLGTLNISDITFVDAAVGIAAFGTVTMQSSGLIRFVPTKNIAANANLYPRIITII